MYLIVGLGNPGKKYAYTRHNVGFAVVEILAARMDVADMKTKYRSKIVKVIEHDPPLILAMPQTYMNNSGQAVREIVRGEEIEIDKMIVIHDDVDLPIGTIRVRSKGSSGGHNGIESIIEYLSASDFIRVRVGIGRSSEGDVTDYVLQEIPSRERGAVTQSAIRAADAVENILKHGVESTMNQFNAPAE